MSKIGQMMTPYYQLTHGDCLEILPTLESVSIDVGITSPPYNLGGDFHSCHNGQRQSWGGYEDFDDNLPEPVYQEQQIFILDELHRIHKPGKFLFYVHKNRIKDGRIISPISWLEKTKWIIYQDVVINLSGTSNVDKRRFFPVHEFIFILASDDTARLKNESCLTSVWTMPQVNRKQASHPASFHPRLVKNCLEAAARPGDTVIDPFMGSGTTGKVAINLGMKFIGIERAAGYLEMAQAGLNLPLFVPELEQLELLSLQDGDLAA